MPPPDAKQPKASERLQATELLTDQIKEFHARRDNNSRETVLRRLNNREYNNVVRDLFGFDMSMYRPTQHFPRDAQAEHLDNLGGKPGYLRILASWLLRICRVHCRECDVSA